MNLKSLLHEIVDELQHLPANVKGEFHAKVDQAVGALLGENVEAAPAPAAPTGNLSAGGDAAQTAPAPADAPAAPDVAPPAK